MSENIEDQELKFLRSLGVTQKTLNQLPNSLVNIEKGKVRLMIRSDLEQPITVNDRVMVTMSPREFEIMIRGCLAIIENFPPKLPKTKQC